MYIHVVVRKETETQRRAALEPTKQRFMVRSVEEDTGIDIGSACT